DGAFHGPLRLGLPGLLPRPPLIPGESSRPPAIAPGAPGYRRKPRHVLLIKIAPGRHLGPGGEPYRPLDAPIVAPLAAARHDPLIGVEPCQRQFGVIERPDFPVHPLRRICAVDGTRVPAHAIEPALSGGCADAPR